MPASLLAIAATLAAAVSPQTPPAVLVRGARVLTMEGPPILRGEVLVRGSRIAAVGRGLEIPPGTRVLDHPDGVVTPGFVELHSHVGVSRGDINDMVLPHNMDLRTLDCLLQDSPEVRRATAAGITTMLVIPGSGTSIGGLGTIVKTGSGPLRNRLVRFPGALKIALHARGGNPVRRSGDLGRGRLGLHYMLRVVMAEARDYHAAWTRFERGEGLEPDFNARLHPLRGLFRGEYPVILHAYGQNDTMTAIRILQWGLGLRIVLSHGVYDSFKIKDILARIGVPMNIGPRQYEFEESSFVGNASELQHAGVPVSLCTDAPVVPLEQLFLQAAVAVRLGMDYDAALRGLTIEPARAVFIDDRVGSLAPGKDADLVVFPGDPLDPRNAPRLVMIEGRVVYDAVRSTHARARRTR